MDGVELDELLKKIKKFEKRSHDRFIKQKDSIRDDKEFLFEKYYDDADDKLLGKKRYRGHLDIISNSIRSVVNSYTNYPYKPQTQDPNLDMAFKKLEENISDSVESALKNAVSFGLGYIVVLPEENNGVIYPSSYSIENIEGVYFDPDSIKLDGSDATEILIADIKSKNFIKNTYGEEVLKNVERGLTLDLSTPVPDDCMVIFTYFKKENDLVYVYKIVGDTLVEEPLTLRLSQIPVIPVYGEDISLENKRYWRGIIAQSKPIQKMSDYTFSQLMERLAKSPKNIWLTTPQTVENWDDYYKNSDKSINQLLFYNPKTGKEVNEKPELIQQTVQYNDLTDIMGNTLGLMKSVVGVDSVGLPDEKNEITATEALLNAKTYNNNIRHYIQHLKFSFKALCKLIVEYFNRDASAISIFNGPDENMQRQTARVTLTQLAGLLQDPGDKKRAILAIASTMNDNQFVLPFIQAVSTPDPMVVQLQQQMQQMQQQNAVQTKQLQDQIQLLKTQAIALENRNKDTMNKAILDNQTKVLIEQMKQEGLDNRQADEQMNENARDYENKVMEVQKEKIKTAGEVAKAAAQPKMIEVRGE